jgi:hypothetical protein
MTAIPREVFDGFVRDAEHAYALGLWCADGYWWSSSIGISSVEPELVVRFGNYLMTELPQDRLRLRIYEVGEPDGRVLALTDKISRRPAFKMKRTAYHLYVNSRPLVRTFFSKRERLEEVPDGFLGPYFAGRFDGDGCWGDTPRIAYTSREEAVTDAKLLVRAGICRTSVLFYEKANEYCIYVQRPEWERFDRLIAPYSWKVNRRVTL